MTPFEPGPGTALVQPTRLERGAMMRITGRSKGRILRIVLDLYDGNGNEDDAQYLEQVLRSGSELAPFAIEVIQLDAMLAAVHRPTPFDDGVCTSFLIWNETER